MSLELTARLTITCYVCVCCAAGDAEESPQDKALQRMEALQDDVRSVGQIVGISLCGREFLGMKENRLSPRCLLAY